MIKPLLISLETEKPTTVSCLWVFTLYVALRGCTILLLPFQHQSSFCRNNITIFQRLVPLMNHLLREVLLISHSLSKCFYTEQLYADITYITCHFYITIYLLICPPTTWQTKRDVNLYPACLPRLKLANGNIQKLLSSINIY